MAERGTKHGFLLKSGIGGRTQPHFLCRAWRILSGFSHELYGLVKSENQVDSPNVERCDERDCEPQLVSLVSGNCNSRRRGYGSLWIFPRLFFQCSPRHRSRGRRLAGSYAWPDCLVAASNRRSPKPEKFRLLSRFVRQLSG